MNPTERYLDFRRRGLRPLAAFAAALAMQVGRPARVEDVAHVFRCSCDAGLRACIRTAREVLGARVAS